MAGFAAAILPGQEALFHTPDRVNTSPHRWIKAEASAYEASLRGGVGVLNFSSLEVDADFVNGWVSRIATDAEGYKQVPVAIAMQHITTVSKWCGS
jgi:hypothetical protein